MDTATQRLKVTKAQALLLDGVRRDVEQAQRNLALVAQALTAGRIPAGAQVAGVDTDAGAVLYVLPPEQQTEPVT